MAFTEYVGARYVPIFGRIGDDTIEWDNSKEYEPLTIVLHQGNSFTSRQYVPVGIDINDGEYWAETGNFNAQIEQYRAEVLGFDTRISDLEKHTILVYPEQYGAIGDGVTDDTIPIQNAIDVAINSSGCVVFQNKNYRITRTINVSNQVLITGAEIQEYTPSIISDFEGVMFNVTHAGVCFSNICMTSTSENYFKNTAINAIAIPDVDMWIRQCKFFYFAKCIVITGRSVVFENNNFSNSGICVEFNNSPTTDTARSYLFFNNRFHTWGRTTQNENTGHGIVFAYDYGYNRNEIFFTGNYIDLSSSSGAFFYGDYVTGYISNNFYVYNNAPFFNLKKNNFNISNESNLYIAGNYIKSRISAPLETAFVFEGCEHVYLQDNKLHNVRNSIINMISCSNSYIQRNESHNTSQHPLVKFVNVTDSSYIYIESNSNNSSIDYIVTGDGSNIFVFDNNCSFKKLSDFNVYSRNIKKWQDFASINLTSGQSIDTHVIAPNEILLEILGTAVPFYRSVNNRYVTPFITRNEITQMIYGYVTMSNGVLTYGKVATYNLSTGQELQTDIPITRIISIN